MYNGKHTCTVGFLSQWEIFLFCYHLSGCPPKVERASPVAPMVENLPAVREPQETLVRSLGQKDPRRGKWQPTPVFLPEESPWTEEPGGLQSTGLQRVGHDVETEQAGGGEGHWGVARGLLKTVPPDKVFSQCNRSLLGLWRVYNSLCIQNWSFSSIS